MKTKETSFDREVKRILRNCEFDETKKAAAEEIRRVINEYGYTAFSSSVVDEQTGLISTDSFYQKITELKEKENGC